MSTFEERRKARLGWPIRKVSLTAEGLTDERLTQDVDERIALVNVLTLAQWKLAGKELPRYSRAEMPGRVLRPGR